MEKWIPLFTALIWPALILGAVIWLNDPIKKILASVAARVASGDDFEAGKDGIKLKHASQGDGNAHLLESIEEDQLPNVYYMLHSAKRDKSLDKEDLHYYRLRIWLDADEPEMLEKVESVTYHLHETFTDPVRTVTDASSKFTLATACWGEFNMYAVINFKDGKTLSVERYMNL